MDFEKSIETITGFLAEHELRYALIGGLALAAYGHPRSTLDLDLVVDLEDQAEIIAFMERLGFETLHRSPGYSNHSHEQADLGRVDFVYVSGTTSDQIFGATTPMPGPGGLRIPVPKAEHLIAMKVLAMKNDPGRTFQELADIRNLILDPGVERHIVQQYFEKHSLRDRWDELEASL